ncbi:MAG: carboxylate--amine ligase [Deltaproteobacteria bacterium]|nr:carboxylate--amine ligase [Deltaproteobacteria bacterium]
MCPFTELQGQDAGYVPGGLHRRLARCHERATMAPMNLLYISPDFPPNYASFSVALAQAGVNVLGVGEAAFFEMPERTRDHLLWYVRANLHDPGDVLRAVGELEGVLATRDLGAIELCESHNEAWMRLEALVNAALGLPGIRPADLERLQRKSVMKQQFREHGLPAAPGLLVGDREACFRLGEEVGYPLLLKPDLGVGAMGVRRVDDRAELAFYLSRLTEPYVLEQFLHGRMVTYDGLADWDGNVIFDSSLVYGSGVLESVSGGDTFFYSRRAIPPALAAMGRSIVGMFGIRRKFFHLEFFETGRGELVPVEVNARPPGGPILDLMNFSADCDLYAAYAAMLTGRPVALPEAKPFFCAYAGRKERPYRHSQEQILERYGAAIVEHGENPPLHWIGMGRQRYLYRTTEEVAVHEFRELVFAT